MKDLSTIRQLLSQPKNIAIIIHHNPDADALGSGLGLSNYLQKKGHQVKVISPSDFPDFLEWMQGSKEVLIYNDKIKSKIQSLLESVDIIFCLDFSSLNRINEMGEMLGNVKGKKILIDHHLEPEKFPDLQVWDDKASATAELVFELIKFFGDKSLITTDIGECLYAGIMTDTGSFRYPSTSKAVHLIIAELIDIGINITKVHKLIYDNYSEKRLRFLGYALKDKLVVLKKYSTAYISINAAEMKKYNVKTGDTEGLVNYALSIKGIVFGALITERKKEVRLSFRSVGDFSANDLARKHFDGGGHTNAAGGKSKLPFDQTIKKFVDLLADYKDLLVDNYE